MEKTATVYAGLKLKNPIMISSSGLTDKATKNLELERAGAGAIVLKSLFEEQILLDSSSMDKNSFPESEYYISNYLRANNLKEYLDLIEETNRLCSIPVIASINCYSTEGWLDFAHKIELAGADALELNIYLLNHSLSYDEDSFIRIYIDIVRKVRAMISIPVIVKIGQNFNNIPWFVNELKQAGAAAVVLFNRFYQPDIDLDKMTLSLTDALSNPSEVYHILRWTGIVSGTVPGIDVAASSGIHTGESLVKTLLAGASVGQICSAIYKSGPGVISEMINFLDTWMNCNGFETIADFKGKLNYMNIDNPVQYERLQFMKYISPENK